MATILVSLNSAISFLFDRVSLPSFPFLFSPDILREIFVSKTVQYISIRLGRRLPSTSVHYNQSKGTRGGGVSYYDIMDEKKID